MQLEIERASLAKETDDGLAQRARGASSASSPSCASRPTAMKAEWQAEKDAIQAASATSSERLEQATRGARARRARGRPGSAPPSCATARSPSWRSALAEAEADARTSRASAASSRRRSTAEDIAEVVGRWTGIPVSAPARGRGREARAHGGAPAPARHRPGRGGSRRRRRAAPLARRPAGPRPARSARSCSSARPASARPSWRARWPSSCSTRQDAMVRIDMSEYMEKHAVSPAGRRASRLRRLRRGRPAHRGGAPPALHASCCSTRSRRRTRTSSTCCCR